MWQKVADEFAKENTILMLDLPGFGQSNVLDHSNTIEEMATIVFELLLIKIYNVQHLLGTLWVVMLHWLSENYSLKN